MKVTDCEPREDFQRWADLETVNIALNATLEFAKRRGLVVTVSQKPCEPLAMGNYETVVEVRQDRTAYRS